MINNYENINCIINVVVINASPRKRGNTANCAKV